MQLVADSILVFREQTILDSKAGKYSNLYAKYTVTTDYDANSAPGVSDTQFDQLVKVNK